MTNSTLKNSTRLAGGALALAMFLGLGGCAGMSRTDQNTAVGAGVGAVGGAVLTGGSTIGTLGGAAIGGYIGNKVGN
ncbi:MAG: glycine zipper 2TM domain-containing protein [Pseudomonadota bacterium]